MAPLRVFCRVWWTRNLHGRCSSNTVRFRLLVVWGPSPSLTSSVVSTTSSVHRIPTLSTLATYARCARLLRPLDLKSYRPQTSTVVKLLQYNSCGYDGGDSDVFKLFRARKIYAKRFVSCFLKFWLAASVSRGRVASTIQLLLSHPIVATVATPPFEISRCKLLYRSGLIYKTRLDFFLLV